MFIMNTNLNDNIVAGAIITIFQLGFHFYHILYRQLLIIYKIIFALKKFLVWVEFLQTSIYLQLISQDESHATIYVKGNANKYPPVNNDKSETSW